MIEKIKQWINQHKEQLGITNYELIDVSSKGLSNYVFHLKAEKDLIVRTNRPPGSDRISHEHRILTFLHKQGIQQIPQIVFYEEDSSIGRPILVETFVGEYAFDNTNITPVQREALAKLIAKIHTIPVKAYDDFFKTETPKSLPFHEFMSALFKERPHTLYEKYKKLVDKPDPYVTTVYNELKKLVDAIKSLSLITPITVVHGDVGNNIRYNNCNNNNTNNNNNQNNQNNLVYLVDWEFATAGSPVEALAHFFIVGHVPLREQEKFLQIYKKYHAIPGIDEMLLILNKFMDLVQVIWSVRRFARAAESDIERKDLYLARFEEAIKTVKEKYNIL